MRHELKRILLFLGILLAVFSPVQAARSVATVAQNADVDTLSLWVMNNGIGSQRALARIVRKFQRETTIPVQVRFLDWGAAFGEISKALDSGHAPDVLQLGSTWVPYFAAAGKIAPLSFLLDKIDTTRFFRESFKSSHVSLDSQVFSFPWFVDVRALYANEKKWNALGLKDSDVSSYAGFVGTLRAFFRLQQDSSTKVAPFALPGKGDWTGPHHMAPFIWSFGGDFLAMDSSGYRSALLDSGTLSGLRYFLSILADRELSPYGLEENSVQNTERFIQSGQLVLFGTSEIIRQMEISSDDGGLKESPIASDGLSIVGPLQGPAGKVAFVGGSHLALSINHKKTAEQLMQFLLRADNMDAYTRQVGFLPADEGIVNIWGKDPRYSQLIKTMKTGRSFPNISEWVAVEETLIELTNSLGELFRTESPSVARNRRVVELLWAAHVRIEKAVGHELTMKKPQVMPYIEKILFASVEEKTPDALDHFLPEIGGNILLRTIVSVLALIVVAALALVLVKKFRKS